MVSDILPGLHLKFTFLSMTYVYCVNRPLIDDPKLPLGGLIYMLTVGSVLTTNLSQISLCQLLFRATLKVRLDSCLSLLLEQTTLTAPK